MSKYDLIAFNSQDFNFNFEVSIYELPFIKLRYTENAGSLILIAFN